MTKTSNLKSKHRYSLRLQNKYFSKKASDKGLPTQSSLVLQDLKKTSKNFTEPSPRYSLRSKDDQSSKKSTIRKLQHSSKKISTKKQILVKKNPQGNISKSCKNSLNSYKKLNLPNKSANKIQDDCLSLSENINTSIKELSSTPKSSKKRKVKSNGFKKTPRSSLKRKKSAIEAIIKADENYEDDLYESKKFDQFKDLLVDSPNSERSFSISPPEFPVTPIIRNKTPEFKDCFSPGEYETSRKAAMAYMYRKDKRRSCQEPPETLVVAVKKKLEFSEAIENAQKLQTTIERLANNESDDDDSDF